MPADSPNDHGRTKYLRTIHAHPLAEPPFAGAVRVDVYDVAAAFDVQGAALTHCLKKVLCAGRRGKADQVTDLLEARVALDRAIDFAERAAREAANCNGGTVTAFDHLPVPQRRCPKGSPMDAHGVCGCGPFTSCPYRWTTPQTAEASVWLDDLRRFLLDRLGYQTDEADKVVESVRGVLSTVLIPSQKPLEP